MIYFDVCCIFCGSRIVLIEVEVKIVGIFIVEEIYRYYLDLINWFLGQTKHSINSFNLKLTLLL